MKNSDDQISYRSGLAEKSQLGFHTFTEPVELTVNEKERMIQIGRLSASILRKTTVFVAETMASDKREDDWIRNIMLGSIPVEHRRLARDLMVAVGDNYPVRFFRADVMGDGRIAELQCPGSGWAYTQILEECYGIPAANSSIVKAYRDFSNGQTLSWWLHDVNHIRSVRHLVKMCQKAGVLINLAETEPDRDSKNVSVMIKRPPLPELITTDSGRRLCARWLADEVHLDLLPTMVPETKYLMALLYHPKTHHLYTDEERGICPPTYFVDAWDTKIVNNNRVWIIEKAIERHRPLILKYGGAIRHLRGGCHAVYNLGIRNMKHAERRKFVDIAIADYQRGEAWIVQDFVNQKRVVPEKPHPQYVLLRPHFFIENTGAIRLVNNTITCRDDWKVHARSDAWLGLCY